MSNLLSTACRPLQMPPTAKAVLMAMADYADDNGVCWPSITSIGEYTCFGRTAVIGAIAKLEEMGLVARDKGAFRSNQYRILVRPAGDGGAREFHYVYRITHTPSGSFYIGVRSTFALPEQDPYFGSGKECGWLSAARADCVKEVVSIYPSRQEAAEAETAMIGAAISDPLCLNKRLSAASQSIRLADRPLGEQSASRTEQYVSRTEESGRRTYEVREADRNHQEPSRTTNKATTKVARKRADPTGPIASIKGVAVPARPDDVLPQTWADWLGLRKAKAAPVTVTVMADAQREAGKAGLSLTRFLEIWCTRGSQGLQADWLKPHERAGPASVTPIRPSAAANFQGKTYAGTAIEDLPPDLRDAARAALADG